MGALAIGAGDVKIMLGGEEVVLRPTLRATQTISRQYDGISTAVDRLVKFDFDTMAQVIAQGTGRSDLKVIQELIYETGMSELVGPLTRYLSILANGGRPPESDENPQN